MIYVRVPASQTCFRVTDLDEEEIIIYIRDASIIPGRIYLPPYLLGLRMFQCLG
ncbi:hypothetical protein HYDPIDRAFT_114893 [Hydnomerulius pinastri MD-312]|uniref:Uncharacterized protein n=1 Tax=Hydnomerulius pinastri MD-312 TaxID=994086 RepID=A0A0C9WCQ6_9AGAM|nr:hypothetical protein HYDPIDRAFT_114893 [Hydnomerulius pinastri MD-312]